MVAKADSGDLEMGIGPWVSTGGEPEARRERALVLSELGSTTPVATGSSIVRADSVQLVLISS